jgi:DNA-binding LacI/PurR family transcriptional regulator
VQHGPIDLGAAAAMMKKLLALPASRRPTAVLGTNDIFAVGAMVACRAEGVRIPEEISITGCDNTDLGATQTPALTSIRTPIVEIGRAAAERWSRGSKATLARRTRAAVRADARARARRRRGAADGAASRLKYPSEGAARRRAT